ncbi:hypothetical protein J6590_024018, partial [Homalodisca vitripennis]
LSRVTEQLLCNSTTRDHPNSKQGVQATGCKKVSDYTYRADIRQGWYSLCYKLVPKGQGPVSPSPAGNPTLRHGHLSSGRPSAGPPLI